MILNIGLDRLRRVTFLAYSFMAHIGVSLSTQEALKRKKFLILQKTYITGDNLNCVRLSNYLLMRPYIGQEPSEFFFKLDESY